MGCIVSYCCDQNTEQDEDPDVRTRLLADPVSNSSTIPCGGSESNSSQYQSSLPKKANEQSVLNRILQTTAQNVIDVAALGPQNIEQNEYLERRNQYSAKVNHLPPTRTSSNVHGILIDFPNPEKILSSSISDDDYILIRRASCRFKNALSELKVKHSEDLIVPFHIGTM